jgi:hypothetical protein
METMVGSSFSFYVPLADRSVGEQDKRDKTIADRSVGEQK